MPESKIVNTYMKAVTSVVNKIGLLGAFTMIGLMMLTVADVFLRKFFNAPILGSYEITEFLLVVLVFFAIPWAALKKANVKVDLIVGELSERVQDSDTLEEHVIEEIDAYLKFSFPYLDIEE